MASYAWESWWDELVHKGFPWPVDLVVKVLGREIQNCEKLDCNFGLFAGKHEETAQDYVIWIQNCDKLSSTTGLPTVFKVYVQNRRTDTGMHKNWDACYYHARLAYVNMQEIYADEVKETERTDRWLDRRNGRV